MGPERKIMELQARLCQVLSSPKRLEILYTLKEQELAAGELARAVGVSTPNLSQHLAMMRQHGLVEARKEGMNVYYRLAAPEILHACEAVRSVLLSRIANESELLGPGDPAGAVG